MSTPDNICLVMSMELPVSSIQISTNILRSIEQCNSALSALLW